MHKPHRLRHLLTDYIVKRQSLDISRPEQLIAHAVLIKAHPHLAQYIRYLEYHNDSLPAFSSLIYSKVTPYCSAAAAMLLL